MGIKINQRLAPHVVILENNEGKLVNWGPHQAVDEDHAAELAYEFHPEKNIIGVRRMEME